MIEIRLLRDIEEITFCEDIQKVAWGMDEAEVVPGPQLNALYYSGGILAGAFDGQRLIGFIVGFLAKHDNANPNPNAATLGDDVGIHSHMMAVVPEYQGQGIGRKLKWFQRDWCIQQGYNWVSWTFDPMQAKNARLNLEHFGAFANHYKVNVYGEMRDDLNRGMESDRLLAWWDLKSAEVEHISKGNTHPDISDISLSNLDYGLRIMNKTINSNLELIDECVRIDVPENLIHLLKTDLSFAHSCREATREVFLRYFSQGYTAKRFLEGSYILFKDS